MLRLRVKRMGLCGRSWFTKVASNIRITSASKGSVMVFAVAKAFKMPRFFLPAIAFATLIGLSGCKMFVKEEPPSCPRVSVLADGAHLVRFRAGATSEQDADIALRAKIAGYRGACRYDKDSKTMEVAFRVGFDAARGPGAAGNQASFSYFIAIPKFQGNPDGKKELPVSFDLPANGAFQRFEDQEVVVSFPVKDVKDLQGYEVFLGIQLSQAELEYNRHHTFH